MSRILMTLKASPSQHLRLIVATIVAMGLFLASSLFVQSRSVIIHPETSDFSAYYAAYMIKRELGAGIYDRENINQISHHKTIKGSVREYLYPPLLAESLSLFMPEDYTKARLVWLVIEHISFFAIFLLSAILSIKIFSAPAIYAFMISALICVGFSAAERSFFYGQASLIMVVIIYLAVLFKESEYPYVAAFFAALATVLKIYAIVYLVALLLKARYKEASAMILFMVLIVSSSILLFGIDDWLSFLDFQAQNPLVDRGTENLNGASALYDQPNYSPTALFFLLSDQFGLNWTQLQIWTTIKIVMMLVSVLILVIFYNKISKDMEFIFLLGLGFSAIMMMSPLLWNHVFVLLLPILSVLACAYIVREQQDKYSLIFLTVSVFLLSFPDFLTNMHFTNNGALVLLKYTKLYGLIILSFVLLKEYKKSTLRD